MGFYASISDYYDRIFPYSRKQLEFITKRLSPPPLALLDIGCATGELSLALSEKGYSVTAIDSDAEMISAANKKLQRREGGSIEFRTMNMEDISTEYTGSNFGGVICFGNTLVHVTDPSRLQDQISAFRNVLEKEGLLFVQILNYDYILDNDIERLPVIEDEQIRFERSYRKENGSEILHFDTVLFDKIRNKKITNSIPLYPLRREELHRYVEEAGFTSITCFGGFDSSPLEPTSLPLILTAAL
jgi:2-polyprenyl-3-methyl-5-hydroxy-6-metoxy-1,4-benzoquinol methylase